MPFTQPIDFPDIKITNDPEKANYQNFLAWQAQNQARRRESATQFNLFQTRARDRICSQVLYKEEAEQQTEALRDMVERRLSVACDCNDCDKAKERSNSFSSATPSSPTTSVRSSSSSLGPALSPVASTPSSSTRAPSGRNSLIVSPPPRSRHHKRRTQSTKS